MDGLDLATEATIGCRVHRGAGRRARHIVAYDYGMKRNILRLFLKNGCRVTVVPAATPAARIASWAPDGLFLSNGPEIRPRCPMRSPRCATWRTARFPIFGICLGHQMLGLALGERR